MQTAAQRKNLLKLAAYLESLPADYKHFDMYSYARHCGDCELPMSPSMYAAKRPARFLANCGTVACAVGHGPAAGIRLRADEIDREYSIVEWSDYSDRVFGTADSRLFDFLFDSPWQHYDNHHYGAAARIRYYLTTGQVLEVGRSARRKYAPYRKGSRSAVRRQIEQVSA